ncbi:MAG: ABC transporter substrate-binding protein [Wenzhouxiangellaceae bacterium]|jgi:phospholipid transport system substrate-binding protein|nr:ABC transporter substrate-binding protein [Wenzhouxiangellaceae bacterium]MBS3745504.1 ABC transporter substrate-binding protein [Wenzhouxiangellaceae bacterium]MBS3823121.1 ABC transporter substrate-binding protein [Wenzhouxiangellaceae bacterium]
MIGSRTIFATLSLVLAAGLAAQTERGPVDIVRETTNELFSLVDENREMYENDIQALRDDIRPILLDEVDTLYSGRLVLGRSSRGMEREKIEEFSDALSELLIRRYADGLLDFQTRDQVEIRPLAGDNTERMTRVKTRVQMNNGEEAPVDYVFRKTDKSWKIFDVIVEGISYVTTFRNQIGEQIRQEGFDATLEKLKQGEVEIEVDDK